MFNVLNSSLLHPSDVKERRIDDQGSLVKTLSKFRDLFNITKKPTENYWQLKHVVRVCVRHILHHGIGLVAPIGVPYHGVNLIYNVIRRNQQATQAHKQALQEDWNVTTILVVTISVLWFVRDQKANQLFCLLVVQVLVGVYNVLLTDDFSLSVECRRCLGMTSVDGSLLTTCKKEDKDMSHVIKENGQDLLADFYNKIGELKNMGITMHLCFLIDDIRLIDSTFLRCVKMEDGRHVKMEDGKTWSDEYQLLKESWNQWKEYTSGSPDLKEVKNYVERIWKNQNHYLIHA